MTATERVEQAAILVAETYVAANSAPRVAAGLLLVGMAVAASASPAAQRLLLAGYVEQHPSAARSIAAWAKMLSEAAAE